MTVTFQLPADLEEVLRADLPDVASEAREAFLVDLYRRGRFSHAALGSALGIDRLETEEVLRKHNVVEDLGTLDEYLTDARRLKELRTKAP